MRSHFLGMPKKRPSCARLTTVIRARIYPVKDVVDRHSTGTRIHGERRDGYVRYHARARSAILLADWPRRNEQRSEAVKRRGERRGRYPSEGESTALGVRGGWRRHDGGHQRRLRVFSSLPLKLSRFLSSLLAGYKEENLHTCLTCLPRLLCLFTYLTWLTCLAVSLLICMYIFLGISRNLMYISLFIIHY